MSKLAFLSFVRILIFTPDNGAKNLLTNSCIEIKFMLLLPKDYYLIPSKGTKNLFKPNRNCMLIIKIVLSMIVLKIWFCHNTASAQVIQVIKMDL